MYRKKFIDKLRDKYQQGGARSYYEDELNTIGDSRKSLQQLRMEKRSARYMQNGGVKDMLKFGLKGAKPFLKGAAKRLSGPLGLVLGSKTAYAEPVIDESGTNRFTGKQEFTPFGQGPPPSWSDDTKKQTGGMYNQMQQYQAGGVALPGGEMNPIPGSDAVEFSGQTHDEGGIMMDSQTEVEDGETMDQVNMAKKGGKRDYFFSSYLKKGGRSFADMHKDILRDGGNQEEINMLARMQEKAAGRNPNQVAKLGGVIKYQTGGALQDAENAYNKHEANKPTPPTFDLSPPKQPRRLSSNANATEKKMHEAKMQDYQTKLDAYNAAKAEHGQAMQAYETELADWEATENKLSTDIEMIEADIEMAEQEAEEKAAEEERIAQEKTALKTKAQELNKKAQELGIDTKEYRGKGGGILPSKVDALEAEVNSAETALKAKADELGIEYDENTDLSKLDYNVTEAGYEYQGGMEGDKLPGGKGVTDTQDLDAELAKKLGITETYLEDEELKAELMGEDWTMENWMATLDQELLEQAGIKEKSDWNDRSKVKKYQQGLIDKYDYNTGDKSGNIKGLVGEKIFRSAPNAIETAMQKSLPEVTVEDKLTPEETVITEGDEGGDSEAIIPDEGGDDSGTIDLSSLEDKLEVNIPTFNPPNINFNRDDEGGGDREPYNARVPWQAYGGMAAGLGAGLYSLFHKQPAAQQAGYTQGFMSPIVPERGKAPRLARYDYNQDIANVGSEVRGMNKYIETSGGGPANMVNKMMAFSRGEDAKMKIRAAETRANIGVQNTEAQLKQQMELDNLKRSQNAAIFNAQMIRAEAARRDTIDEANTARRQKRQDDMEFQKYAGVSSIASSLQTGFGDILDYKADMAMADAIGSDTGVFNRSTLAYLNSGGRGNLVWDAETQSYKESKKFGGLKRMKNYKK